MKRLLCLCLALVALPAGASDPSAPATRLIVVIGADGEDEFGKSFQQAATHWEKAARQAVAHAAFIGREKGTNDLEQLRRVLEQEPREGSHELWLVLIGHGTFDGKEAKFNLRGPDLSAAQLAGWLKDFKRPLALINCASASSPFMNQLAAPNRVVITATRSGSEQNFTRFGPYLAEAIGDTRSDLDKDGQVSLLEAFLTASKNVLAFYKSEDRLATEHALLDDNGDGLGTAADWFRGIRAVKKTRDGSGLDGSRAHQFHLIRHPAERSMSASWRARRDQLELEIVKLREAKEQLGEEEYYRKLEALFVELATLNEKQEAGR